jgi:hypothetical protein
MPVPAIGEKAETTSGYQIPPRQRAGAFLIAAAGSGMGHSPSVFANGFHSNGKGVSSVFITRVVVQLVQLFPWSGN